MDRHGTYLARAGAPQSIHDPGLLAHVLVALAATVVAVSVLIATASLWALLTALVIMPLALTELTLFVGKMLADADSAAPPVPDDDAPARARPTAAAPPQPEVRHRDRHRPPAD